MRKVDIAEVSSYNAYYPAHNEQSAREFLMSHKDPSCSRQLAIFANEVNGHSGRKALRCIINCWHDEPSVLVTFSESGDEQSFTLADDYSERLPQKDARTLARVKRGVPVVVERF